MRNCEYKSPASPGFCCFRLQCNMQSNQENDTRDSGRLGLGRKLQSGNLILVGMMGSGKTTMGRALAKHLGKAFVDSDEEIIKRTGVTIPHIFDIEGEAGFRQREAGFLRAISEYSLT